jgi:hypothetical protein
VDGFLQSAAPGVIMDLWFVFQFLNRHQGGMRFNKRVKPAGIQAAPAASADRIVSPPVVRVERLASLDGFP